MSWSWVGRVSSSVNLGGTGRGLGLGYLSVLSVQECLLPLRPQFGVSMGSSSVSSHSLSSDVTLESQGTPADPGRQHPYLCLL